jgi:DNA repair photolyase
MTTTIRIKKPSRWLNPASGYLTGYTHTLNPYAGCAFSCSYCYVRRMPIGLFRTEPWGEWVDVKQFDGAVFRKEWQRAAAKQPLSVFMSSSTDPYQPIEHHWRITASILEAMAEEPPDFLLLQTRSPLVLRDLELLKILGNRVRVSMSIETDLESVRRAFTPQAPPLAARWRAVRALREAGIPAQIAASPLLPHSNSFAASIVHHASRAVVDSFFSGDGSGGRRTEALKIGEIYSGMDKEAEYSPAEAERFFEELRVLGGTDCDVRWSKEGFLP